MEHTLVLCAQTSMTHCCPEDLEKIKSYDEFMKTRREADDFTNKMIITMNEILVYFDHIPGWTEDKMGVKSGLNRQRFADDCIGALLREIRIRASEKRIKVLVSINGLNAFWQNTTHREADKQFIPAAKLTIVHNFKKMFLPTWNNGIFVGTVDTNANSVSQREKLTPLYLLGKEGFEFMDPFIPIEVSNYTEKEVLSCLEYYTDRMWIQNPRGHSDDGKKELIFLSNKHPYELTRICASW